MKEKEEIVRFEIHTASQEESIGEYYVSRKELDNHKNGWLPGVWRSVDGSYVAPSTIEKVE